MVEQLRLLRLGEYETRGMLMNCLKLLPGCVVI
jgi:hypothetical protein